MKRSLYRSLKADPKAVERFRSYVDQRGPSECWRWVRGTGRGGYGQFGVRGVTFRAHRIAWVLANDRDVPERMVVMHSCDNPRCCNPAHLSVGTHADNARDCASKGRNGSFNPIVRAKLSEVQRERFADPAARAKLSEAQRERFADPAERAKLSEAHRRRLVDPVERAKLSERARKRWSDPAARAKQSEAQRDPAARARLSEASRKRWSDPAARAKQSEAARKRWSDPAARVKASEAQRERFEREWMLKFYGA